MTRASLIFSLALVACGSAAEDPATTCEVDGRVLADGEGFLSEDTCLRCFCDADGPDGPQILCARAACDDVPLPDAGPVPVPDAAPPLCPAPDGDCCDACVLVSACAPEPTALADCLATCQASLIAPSGIHCLALRIFWIDEEGCPGIVPAYEGFLSGDDCVD